MKKLILFSTLTTLGLLVTSTCLNAQTYHHIEVANFEFSPSHLEVNVGDTIEWTNVSGQHNVNGTTSTFSENPASFGNSPGPAGWSYTFIFTAPGNYNYRCDIHRETMTGSLTVSDNPVSVGEIADPGGHFKLYPNPVKNELHWKWNKNTSPTNAYIHVYDVTGKLTADFQLGFESHKDVSDWTEGMYIYTIMSENHPVQTGKLFIIK